jgi:membrane fusion protein (multidrug efflux system)
MADETKLSPPGGSAEPYHDTGNGNGKRRFKALAIILGIFLLAGLGGLLWWMNASQFEETDNATLSGHLHPVSSRIAGTVQHVLVEDNQVVRPGELLVTLEPTDVEVSLSEAEHHLAVARSAAETAAKSVAYTQHQAVAQITQAQGGLSASQAGVLQSRQAVQEARAAVDATRQALKQQEASYQKAATDYRRYRGLDPEAVSAQQLDTAATALQVAEAARNSAQAALSQAVARLQQAQAGVGTSVSRVTQAKGGLESAEAQRLQVQVLRGQQENAEAQVKVAEDALRQARLNLAYTRIYAPQAGRVGRRTVEEGQRIQPGEPLMAIVSPNIWVVANFKETQLQRIRSGQPVDIDIDAYPDHHFTGRVESFSPASGAQFALLPPENATGNFTKIVQRVPVKILLDRRTLRGYEDRLVPGMSVIAKVRVNEPARRATR